MQNLYLDPKVFNTCKCYLVQNSLQFYMKTIKKCVKRFFLVNFEKKGFIKKIVKNSLIAWLL